jgi:hypothetical protein
MLSIREELCRFIRLNEQEQWVAARAEARTMPL